MAKKSTQTVTIKIEITDEMLNKLGESVAKAMTENKVLDLPEQEIPQTPVASEPIEQPVAQFQNNAPAEMPTAPTPNVVPQQGQATQAAPIAQANPHQVNFSQPQTAIPVGQNGMPNAGAYTNQTPSYPVNEAGPAQDTSSAFVAPTTATIPTASAVAVNGAPQGTAPLSISALSTAGARLVESNPALMPQLTGLLARYGVNTINVLPPEYFESFANDLRALGANI